jgi:hypothetical protein
LDKENSRQLAAVRFLSNRHIINLNFFVMIKPIASIAAFVLMVTILCWQGCTRPDTQPMAGRGGKATLVLAAKHHSTYVDSIMCYIKYNAQDLPADLKFDDSIRTKLTDRGKPTASFIGLKKGKYYIYCAGLDRAFNEQVAGGVPYIISEETIQEYDIPAGGAHGDL